MATVLLFSASADSAGLGKENSSGHSADDTHTGGSSSTIAGPEGVAQELQTAEHREMTTKEKLMLTPWFEWKEQFKQSSGLAFGVIAYNLYQNAGKTTGADYDGLGGIYRFQGSWVLLGRDSSHPGRLEWRVENRSAVGGYLSPSELSADTGAAALNTGFGYSDSFDTDLSVLNWTQLFGDKRAGFAVGRLAYDVYLDAMAFQTFGRGFVNGSFIVNPTMGTTGIGALGAVAKGFVTEQVLIGAHIYDGNAASGDFDMDTFDEHEWLKAVEIAWTPARDRYKTDRIQFTWWDKDEREIAGISQGSGWVVSASWQFNDRLLSFTRFGHSDGGAGVAARSGANLGFEFKPVEDQSWSLGAAWAEPADSELNSEYVLETSYTFQLTPYFSLAPDVQLLLNPARQPQESSVWILGLRSIISF